MEKATVSNLTGNKQQSTVNIHSRGRAEPRDPDQEVTKSERLHWYRYGGGEAIVEARNQLCRCREAGCRGREA